ncbi:hypothetical protein [Pseudoduganella violacea]|uniref:Sn-glycerol-3-phosphate transporter n=1 Tax=Pseudoduganella violacea TaxID=1715466 RepID=A0A7W5BFC6_9BURK|nr:hypothetical protein [Pseudoduganella violacea]MBB3122124.1 hypothetical protein [Pseudoduganella violacea]
MKRAVPLLCAAVLAQLPLSALADPFEMVESKPLNELWINPGFYSWHFQSDKNLDNTNPGLGAEYRFSTVAAVTAGRFHNSDRQMSNYAGIYYQPIKWGPLRIGGVIGGFNGYPKMRDGGWFLAAIPVVSLEYQRVGVNFAIIPTYKERLHGAFSIQLKLKLFE